MSAERPKTIVIFEIVAVAGYALLWLSGRLTEGFDLFDTLFYGALIGLALAVTRFGKPWARFANTVLLITLILISVLAIPTLLEISAGALFTLEIALLAANFVIVAIQLWALWHPETSEWLQTRSSVLSIESGPTSR